MSWCHKYTALCIYSSMRIWLHVYMAPCIYGSMHIWLHVYMAPCVYGSMRIRHRAYMVLTPFTPSSLPLLQACSPHSSLLPTRPLAPYHPEVVGIPIHTKLFIGHWKPAGSKLEPAGSEGSSRNPGILREQGDQAGSELGASWDLREVPGPSNAQGARGASWK